MEFCMSLVLCIYDTKILGTQTNLQIFSQLFVCLTVSISSYKSDRLLVTIYRMDSYCKSCKLVCDPRTNGLESIFLLILGS